MSSHAHARHASMITTGQLAERSDVPDLCAQGDESRHPAIRGAGGSRGSAQVIAANAEAETGDEEGVTLSEFNRWLIHEDNWTSAEEVREHYQEGSQQRKERDETHRERGMERQAQSIEQMKLAKGKVEEHRQKNLEQGKQVREKVADWNRDAYEEREAHKKIVLALKKQMNSAVRTKEEMDALLSMKKKLGEVVKAEDAKISEAAKSQREEFLKINKAQVEKVKKETADQVTEDAKRFFFEKRKTSVSTIKSEEKTWEEARKKASADFKDKVALLKAKSKSIEASARGSRKTLQSQRAREAAEMRKLKAEQAQSFRAAQEEHAATTKQTVYAAVNQKFVQPQSSRRMLQHPHYAEVTAVVTDITSTISKEIAQSPRWRPPSTAGAAAALVSGSKPAALRMATSAGGTRK